MTAEEGSIPRGGVVSTVERHPTVDPAPSVTGPFAERWRERPPTVTRVSVAGTPSPAMPL
jgi:hypothetical protein